MAYGVEGWKDAMRQLMFPIEPEGYREAAGEHAPELPPGAHPHLAELATHVTQGRYDGIVDVGFGLDLVLDGLERLLDPRPAR